MSFLGHADYHHYKMLEKTWHDMKKWDIFNGPGYGFEDLKSFFDRSFFIIEKSYFFKFYQSTFFWPFLGKITMVDTKTSSFLDFVNFFFFAHLVKTYESVHTKFRDLAMSQSRNTKLLMCYKKCVHTLSRLCHAVNDSIKTRHKKLGKFALGMVWKSIKFCV